MEESLGDIFGEIFNDVMHNKGSGIMNDFLEWAEDRSGGKYSSYGEDVTVTSGQEASTTKEALRGKSRRSRLP